MTTPEQTSTFDSVHKFLLGILTIMVTISLYTLNKIDILSVDINKVHDATLIMKSDINVLGTKLDYAGKKIDRIEYKMLRHIDKDKKRTNTSHSWKPSNSYN